MKTSTVTIHMVASLDGFIAKKDNSVSWLQSKDHYPDGVVLTEQDMADFNAKIDCYIMGSRTYEHALELGWPYGNKPVIVLTGRDLAVERSSVGFYSGDLVVLVNEQLRSRYENIWIAGGARVTKEFLRLGLADNIIISIMPVILGEGTPFFDSIGQEQLLHLKEVTTYRDGMVELLYEIKR